MAVFHPIRGEIEKLVSLKPILENTVRRVLKGGDIALLLLDWEIRVAPDDHSSVQYGTATQLVERSATCNWQPGLEPYSILPGATIYVRYC